MRDRVLTVRGVTKHFTGAQATPVHVLEEVSFDVTRGGTLALLGSSGSGKSTLLRIVAGLEPSTAGGVTVHAPAGRTRGRVGIVFQQPHLFPWLTVRENVAAGLRFRANRRYGGERTTDETGGPVERVLADFGIGDLAGAYPDQISGGQAQRVSFARTVVTDPDILLLDEPFAALDPGTRQRLHDWLLGIQRAHELSIVLVTHDVDEAIHLGDEIGLLSGRPARLTEHWVSPPTPGPARSELRTRILECYDADGV